MPLQVLVVERLSVHEFGILTLRDRIPVGVFFQLDTSIDPLHFEANPRCFILLGFHNLYELF